MTSEVDYDAVITPMPMRARNPSGELIAQAPGAAAGAGVGLASDTTSLEVFELRRQVHTLEGKVAGVQGQLDVVIAMLKGLQNADLVA